MLKKDDMIKNILFDWGGVLIHLDKHRCTEAFAQLGVEVSDELTNPYGQRADLKGFERGTMSVDEFHDTVRRLYAPGLTDAQIDRAWNALLLEIPTYKLDMLLKLKERYRLYLLSNTNAVHWEEGRKRFDYKGYRAEDYFEQIFLSQEIHELKPAPEAFLKVAQLAGIEPEETLFIDDLQASCDAAAALGFHTYCPKANSDWRSELKIENLDNYQL
jgi:putative hydrolase of the HAD superfamily